MNNKQRTKNNELRTMNYEPSMNNEPRTMNYVFCKTKPIYRMPKMNLTIVLTKDYGNKRNWTLGENKPNLLNAENPMILSNFYAALAIYRRICSTKNPKILPIFLSPAGLKGYLELLVFFTLCDSFRLYFRNSAREGLLQLFYAIIYIFLPSGGDYFNGTIGHISDLPGKMISICYVIGGKTKTHPLNSTYKSYPFSNLAQSHLPLSDFIFQALNVITKHFIPQDLSFFAENLLINSGVLSKKPARN